MRIYKGRLIGAPASKAQPCVVAVGNFDGVHRGHQAVIASAQAMARKREIAAAALTFEPHPRFFFAPDAPPFRLTPERSKSRKLQTLGLDSLFIADFNAELATLSAERFAADVLGAHIGAQHVVVGSDFRFGAGRAGDGEMLSDLGERNGFTVETITPVGADAVFSSSGVRAALREGRPEAAAEILGGWHRIEGVVEQGDQRGRVLGFPTANLPLNGLLAPKFGVYAVKVEVLGGPRQGRYSGVSSLGVRPQFDKTVPNFETYIFDFDGDIYGEELSVSLVAFLRPEARFESIDALVEQMGADCVAARDALTRAASWR